MRCSAFKASCAYEAFIFIFPGATPALPATPIRPSAALPAAIMPFQHTRFSLAAPSRHPLPSCLLPAQACASPLTFPFDFGCVPCRLSQMHMFSPPACQISPMQFCAAIELPLVVQPYPRLYPFMPFPSAKPTTSSFLQRLPRDGRPFCRIYTAKKVLPRRESTFGTSEGVVSPGDNPFYIL